MEATEKEAFRCKCYELYIGNKVEKTAGMALLDLFQRLAPTTTNEGSSGSSMKEVVFDTQWETQVHQSGFDRRFFEAIRADQSGSLWYELDALKNAARSASHAKRAEMVQNRITQLKEKILHRHQMSTEQQPLPSEKSSSSHSSFDYDRFMATLKNYLCQFGADPGLTLMNYSIKVWLQRQQQNSTSIQWTVDLNGLCERSEAFQAAFLDIVFSLGILVIDEERQDQSSLVWQLKTNLSNAFLKRMTRRIQSNMNITPIAMINTDKQLTSVFTASTVARTNMYGEKEDVMTYVVNQVGSLLSDIGVAF